MPGGLPFGRPFIWHPGFWTFAFRDHHHGFRRFAYLAFGVGYGLYGDDGCWRRGWTFMAGVGLMSATITSADKTAWVSPNWTLRVGGERRRVLA
jgi:hypothetical protein